MAKEGVSFKIKLNAKKYEKVAEEIRERALNLKPWFSHTGMNYMNSISAAHFRTEGGLGGVAHLWSVDYSEMYTKYKQRKVGHLRKEILNTDLRDSLIKKTSSSISVITKTTMKYGTGVRGENGYPYSFVQQKGTLNGTRYLKNFGGKRDRRPVEGGEIKWQPGGRGRPPGTHVIKYKSQVPPRPPVAPYVPVQITASMGLSIAIYIVRGEQVFGGAS